MRILLVPDKSHWSYDQIACAIVKYNTDPNLAFDILPLKANEKEFLRIEKAYHRVLLMGHQLLEMLPWYWSPDPDRHLTGIHSHHAFDPDLRTTPDRDVEPPWELVRTLKRFRAVNCVSTRLFNLFSGKGLNLFLTQNGVDCEMFKPTQPLSTEGPLRVGFAGTGKGIHDRRKGLTEFVIPACQKAGVQLVTAVARTESALSPEEMPAFHNNYDIFLLPSSSEGLSIAMLEALACGRPVISTRVGGSTEVITDLANGFLVHRTVDAIVERLEWFDRNRNSLVAMGRQARHLIEQDWSWGVRAKAWMEFLKA